jgi:hypothetical protein
LPPSGETPNQRSMKSIPSPAVLYHGCANRANSFDNESERFSPTDLLAYA